MQWVYRNRFRIGTTVGDARKQQDCDTEKVLSRTTNKNHSRTRKPRTASGTEFVRGFSFFQNVILPSSKARRENLWTIAAQPATVAPALVLDPPLAFGSRRMTARMVLSVKRRKE